MRKSLISVSAAAVVLLIAIVILVVAQSDRVRGAESFGAPCADITMIAVPGSNETTEGANPNIAVGMLQHVTNPVRALRSSKQLRLHYIGYPSKINDKPDFDVLKAYDSSRSHGYEATWQTLGQYARDCVDTKFVLIGYSQGAHILGDLTATMAHEEAPVRPNRILGIFLLADPALDGHYSRLFGMEPDIGGMFGARSSFGQLSDRVYEVCRNGDPICDVEVNPLALPLLAAFGAGPHVEYHTAFLPDTSVTYTDWIAGRIKVLLGLVGAPPPPVASPHPIPEKTTAPPPAPAQSSALPNPLPRTTHASQMATTAATHPVTPYDNYGTANAGRAMCSGNPSRPESMPGGTASQTFVVPAGVRTLTGAMVQIDPNAAVTAHLTIRVNGAVATSTATAAAGDTHFTFGPVSVAAGQVITLSITFTATVGKIITVYTAGAPGGTFIASNSCSDGAPNVNTSTTGLRAQVYGMS